MDTHTNRIAPGPIVRSTQSGDEATFCGTCAFSEACLSSGYGKQDLAALHCLVEHVQTQRAGEHVFRRGEPFKALYAVRSGSVKTLMFSRDGREQVLGFYLPGEIIGLNGIYPDLYPCDAITLEKTEFCRFSFPAMSSLAAVLPVVQQHLFRLLSKELGMVSLLAGEHTADERVAAFLVDFSERHDRRGLQSSRFRLSMSRSDIASYLRLAPETVSRVLTRFRQQGWVAIEGRHVQLIRMDALRETGLAMRQAMPAG
ncbi:MAG TPA: helix-turn-helix domain-containing protein [Dyella sp.]|uniref:helix-turn-helix domain-containing protein n=1 Tax=Dyella sp. TaxID=1869338 RepID=UPI002D7977E4|nr:helix-turn-helix domain-containing protein [Dyella sp.]HET6555578.1 helix-turn-helix domain-containing protein [Dyella sp.]